MICTAKYLCDLIDEDSGSAWRLQALSHGPDTAAFKVNTAANTKNDSSISEQEERGVRPMSEV